MGYVLEQKIDKEKKTIEIKTDYEFGDFKIDKGREYFYFDFIQTPNRMMGSCLFFNKFGGRKYYPKSIEVSSIDCEKGVVKMNYKV